MPQRSTHASSVNLDVIVAAAAELFDEDGVQAVSMRRVAARCGVSPVVLYRHVGSKDDLIALLANRALDQVELPEPGTLEWREEIAQILRTMHRVHLDHPEFVQITVARPIDAIVAYRGIEMMLGALRRAGLDAKETVAAYDSLVSFTAGFSQQHAARRDRAVPPVQRLAALRGLEATEFENLAELAGLLAMRNESHFDEGLAVVLRGIGAMIEDKRATGS
jgi:AcrR family transcriptional regulator